MNKYVFLSFVFMGWAFFELSGGTDFVPRKAEIMAAAEAEALARQIAEADAQKAAEKAEQSVVLARNPDATPIDDVVQIALAAPIQTYFQTPEQTERPVAPAAAQLQISTEEAFPTPLATAAPALVSLADGGDLFDQAVTQLPSRAEDTVSLAPATLELAATAVAPPTQPIALDLREVAGSRVNMRSGPGTAYAVLASLPRGTAVEVIGADGQGWVQLRTVEDQAVGWMAERLLTPPTS